MLFVDQQQGLHFIVYIQCLAEDTKAEYNIIEYRLGEHNKRSFKNRVKLTTLKNKT